MIDKLEMFIALARLGHFGRAAEECGVTQPTLSAAIKQLEEQLGVVLVLRGSRFQRLTPEGQRVLEWARRIVADARQMRAEMRFATKGLSGNVRIAVIPTALAMVADLTTAFHAEHPNVYFQVLSRSSVEIATMLEDGEADCGITYADATLPERITTVPLYPEAYYLLTPNSGGLAVSGPVTWAEVRKLPLGLLTPDMQNRRIINQLLETEGPELRPAVESDSMIALCAHVRHGACCAIIPQKLAEMLADASGFRALPIDGAANPRQVAFVTMHRDPGTPVMNALLATAQQTSQVV